MAYWDVLVLTELGTRIKKTDAVLERQPDAPEQPFEPISTKPLPGNVILIEKPVAVKPNK
jgi:hypothetical protein